MRTRLFVLVLTFAARAAAGASVTEAEQAVARAAADRERLLVERRALQTQVSALAEGIGALKTPGAEARAGGELARRLREFERAAGRLDAVERDLADRERRLARARAAFEEAADREERVVEEQARSRGAASTAAALTAITEARRRVAALESATRFRAPLDVTIEPLDGPAEIETKIALIEGEQARVAARVAELRGEEALLATRLAAKREWVRELAVARRDAAGGIELLDRATEQAQAALRALASRAEAAVQERAALEAAAERLEERRRDAETRRRALTKGHESR